MHRLGSKQLPCSALQLGHAAVKMQGLRKKGAEHECWAQLTDVAEGSLPQGDPDFVHLAFALILLVAGSVLTAGLRHAAVAQVTFPAQIRVQALRFHFCSIFTGVLTPSALAFGCIYTGEVKRQMSRGDLEQIISVQSMLLQNIRPGKCLLNRF